MITPTDLGLLNRAVLKFGKEAQIDMIREESIELALAICHYRRRNRDFGEAEERLYDELADMKIMMAQADLLFDTDRIRRVIDYKLSRLEENLESKSA